jgi:UDP-3-O-[3-hydroxymyristoyl] N-acetylglucosamine deacetylase / 3-hydroxyacyl-[acyl-carrier-protein] dehydratase
MQRATRWERTLARTAEVRGVGFFHGADVTLRFHPAEEGTGVVFVRQDLVDQPAVRACVDHVVPSQRRTALRAGNASVEMIEHVMAALAGLQIDNCWVHLDAGECPGCDGSSRAFVEALDHAGTVEQRRHRPVLALKKPVTVRQGDAVLTALPSMPGLTLTYHLDYGCEAPIGAQSFSLGLSRDSFRNELASSRTFLLESEADGLRQAGMGQRTTPADLLIFGASGVIGNTLRFADECARHKVLDMVGDLALLGCDLHASVVAHRSGHQMNHALARRLLEQAGRAAPPDSQAVPQVPEGMLAVQSIIDLLPHRYPFLLVDRIVLVEPGRRASAIKNVSINEPYFRGHWPGLPVMPGVLIVEAIAQAAGILIGRTIKRTAGRVAVITSIDGVKLRRPVVPGDQLLLEVVARRIKETAACIVGTAQVGESIVAEAKLRFAIIDAARAAGELESLAVGVECDALS